ncbi:SRPBCC domain-containing protein [Brachybacterium sp. YJGR34]|uniref:SRPBCC domain-containing protein n=1 Tax=Brachybacterium sp. YJGR34 TaxID=2059911 RepID=UPI000E0A1FF9|nr:SRPBCC domain-containing protein [Brachybacterium sp. YJGR34]
MQTETWHHPVGLTHDAGWELGVRRTLPAPDQDVWRRLLSEWLPQWLGVESVPQMVGAPLRRGTAACGRVVGCHMGRRVRLRWQPEALDHETVFQVTLQEAAGGTVLAVHQERLLGPAERQGLLEHWTTVLDQLVADYRRETVRGRDLPG